MSESYNKNIENIVDQFVNNRERIAAIEAREKYAATQADIIGLEGKINSNHQEMQKFINDAVSRSEIRTLKQFISTWATGVTIAVPLLSGIILALLNSLF